MNFKDRVMRALLKNSEKNIPKPIRKHTNVEGPIVLEIYNHLINLGWSLSIVESKAVFNDQAGRYISGKTHPGFSDICGCTDAGVAVFIEVKSTGKRSTIRPEQYDFLYEKINKNCFAIVADSVEYVTKTYEIFNVSIFKKDYLFSELPELAPRYKKRDKDLSFD